MAGLFSNITIKNLTFKNRIVLPPMNLGWADENGLVRKESLEKYIEHYEKIARGGCGLIVMESHSIMKQGRDAVDQLGIWSDGHIKDLNRISKACHKYKSIVLVQIQHAGFKTSPHVSKIAFAPTEFKYNDVTVKALTTAEIHDIQFKFLDAAKRAKKAGLDGVELHGAHGYLLGQFISPITNKREDEYGGSIFNRSRFACEIIKMIKEEVSNGNFIIDYRIGGNESMLEEIIQVAKNLEEAGVDILHVSSGLEGSAISEIPSNFNYNWVVFYGVEIKKHLNVPVIVVNGIRNPKQAEYLLENDLADFIAVGRGQLVDPEWANKAGKGMEVIPCRDCKDCFWFTDGSKCPAAG